MTALTPKYSISESIVAAIALARQALKEIRELARLPGPPGKDGLGFDDLSVDYDGERHFNFRFSRGAETKSFGFDLPVMLDRGVFREGHKFLKGDCVTWGGSLWIAQKDTEGRPNESPDWRLAVKKGRDGKELVQVPRDPSKPVKI